jgi:serine/threonine protein kinase
MATSAATGSTSVQAVSMDDYNILEFIGSGSYGDVFKAVQRKTGQTVAIKQMDLLRQKREGTWLPLDVEREITYLNKCRHENVVQLLGIVIPTGVAEDTCISLILEHMNTDLRTALKGRTQPLSIHLIKHWTTHLLQGIHHIHSQNIIHRDLKPGNLLLNQSGALKIADFGLARPAASAHDQSTTPLTPGVGTRKFKAPEVLLKSKNYTKAVDMWAAGCIFAEMLSGKCLFPGTSEINQITTIFQIMGTPQSSDWPEFKDLTRGFAFPQLEKQDLMLILSTTGLYSKHPHSEAWAMDLLIGMLKYNPAKRTTSRQALRHGWFKEVN